MTRPVMFGKDFIDIQIGRVFADVDGKRYDLFNVKNIKAKVTQENKEMDVLDNTMKQHMATKLKGTFEGSAYGPFDMSQELAEKLKNNHMKFRFSIHGVMDDENPGLGRQSVILQYCLLDEYSLFDLAAEGGAFEIPFSGTFDDWKLAEKFSPIQGMEVR